MLAFRDKIFRDVELHLAFRAKTNGKFWKKHRIQRGLELTHERTRLEQFCHAVAQLYKKSGGGDGVHIELSERRCTSGVSNAMSSFQLTLYVEGPVTALTHFSQSHFTRVTTRVALESALVYHPATGEVETVVKGGAKNHTAMLELFGKHVVQQDLAPERIEPQRYHLNALRDGLQPYEDWSAYGVEMVRLRRARLTPVGIAGVSFTVEASPTRPRVTQSASPARRSKSSICSRLNITSTLRPSSSTRRWPMAAAPATSASTSVLRECLLSKTCR